jgi:cytochrome c peroxidase
LALALLATPARAQEADPAEITLGERLFLETRFAQYFARASRGDVNATLASGDPVVDVSATTGVPLAGPFAGQSINCVACHLVDQQLDTPGGGMRTYADFARQSPVPARRDRRTLTARNSPPLVNASLPQEGGLLLHFDGEFASVESLVRGTFTGRNFGWLPSEERRAVRHIARVIREDDGTGQLAQEFGGPYAMLLTGTDTSIPPELRLPETFRVDVARATDRAIVDAVARLIAAYVESLVFAQDETGAFAGSPFDRFLEANALPHGPEPGEAPLAFDERLGRLLRELEAPVFIDDGDLRFHQQRFAFGPTELRDAELFFGEASCSSCHRAPTYTDAAFHNTGVTQRGYDALHGEGVFGSLEIPSLRRRRHAPSRYLPATARHPRAREPFRSLPHRDRPGLVDLGLWNVFANPDFPEPQERIWSLLCRAELERTAPAGGVVITQVPGTFSRCSAEALLPTAIARFKTPGLRDLGHSAPYLHDGSAETLEEVVLFYQRTAELARAGALRNADPALMDVVVTGEGVAPLAAFLRALNEDYE